MVATTIPFPNVRKLFLPDPGYMIADVDLAGAEAQVVAWDAGDEDLKAAFRAGINVHVKNARDVFPVRTKGWSDEAVKADSGPGGVYYLVKRCVHGTHNGGKPKGLATQIGITVAEAANFQHIWFGLHPKIKEREERIMQSLEGRLPGIPPRTIRNQFGYSITYFDRIENVFTEALTWIQQSTVGICCERGLIALRDRTPWCELLLQVHDSIVLQFPKDRLCELHKVRDALRTVIVPYPDPLYIPWDVKVSDRSWGHCKDFDWDSVAG